MIARNVYPSLGITTRSLKEIRSLPKYGIHSTIKRNTMYMMNPYSLTSRNKIQRIKRFLFLDYLSQRNILLPDIICYNNISTIYHKHKNRFYHDKRIDRIKCRELSGICFQMANIGVLRR